MQWTRSPQHPHRPATLPHATRGHVFQCLFVCRVLSRIQGIPVCDDVDIGHTPADWRLHCTLLPLLCCGKPAFDLVDIFVDCIRESSALMLRAIRTCYNQARGKFFDAGIQTAVPPPTVTDKQETVVDDLC